MSERLQELQMLLSDDPGDIFVLYAIGLEYFKMGKTDEAIRSLEELILISPEYIPAYFRLGQWFAEKDQIEQAKAVLMQALALSKSQNDTKAAQEIQELLLFIDDYED